MFADSAAVAIIARRTFYDLCVEEPKADEVDSTRRARSYSDSAVSFCSGAFVCGKVDDAECSTRVGSERCDLSDQDSNIDVEEMSQSSGPNHWPIFGLELQSNVVAEGGERDRDRRPHAGRYGRQTANVARKHKRECATGLPIPVAGERTTLMFRNLPCASTRVALQAVLDASGFAGLYDFVYVPIDFVSRAALGYGFVNMTDAEHAKSAMEQLQGFEGWSKSGSSKVLEICWSDPCQGLDMLIERYRNSKVMHDSVPDDYKPALFSDGSIIPFPARTRRVRTPFPKGGAHPKA